MRLFVAIFLVLNFLSLLSYAQTPDEPDKDIEAFKEKLQKYYEKRNKYTGFQMPVKPLDSAQDNMPTGNIRSLMIDEELGLAYEFSTQKIYDKETKLIYYIETEKIYDPETDTYYNYEINPKQ